MREEVAQSEGFEFVVHLAVAGAGGELVLEPRAERGFEGLAGGRGAFGEVAKGAGKVLRENDAAIRDGDGVLEDVAEFADVAGPGVALEQFRGGGGKLCVAVGREHGKEGGGKRGHIGGAFVEGGQGDFEDVQAVVEILPETSGADFVAEVFVGRGDEPEIDAQILASADAGEGALLDEAQKFRLNRG